jgi:hypothetical protein
MMVREKDVMCNVLRLAVLIFILLSGQAMAAEPESNQAERTGDIGVMQAFADEQVQEGEAVRISDQRKHFWLFIMGVMLLTLVLLTATLGIMMGVYGKDVFIAHMLTAGLTVTLAVAHAIAAIVWFNPFS